MGSVDQHHSGIKACFLEEGVCVLGAVGGTDLKDKKELTGEEGKCSRHKSSICRHECERADAFKELKEVRGQQGVREGWGGK